MRAGTRSSSFTRKKPSGSRGIFRRYLELVAWELLPDLRERGVLTKLRRLSNGRTVGGIQFTRGPLAYLLRNPFYLGEVVFECQIFLGEHPPILDRDLFEAVQLRLAEQHNGYRAARANSELLLIGRIFDDRGNRIESDDPSDLPSGSSRATCRVCTFGGDEPALQIAGEPVGPGCRLFEHARALTRHVLYPPDCSRYR